MKHRTLITVSFVCATIWGGLIVSQTGSARGSDNKTTPPLSVYFLYPLSGVIPRDLISETDRVNPEIDGIEQEAIAQWRALPPLTPSGDPPVLKGSGLSALLGKLENVDTHLSVGRNEAGAFSPMPYTGFSGPTSSLNATTVAYPGAFHFRFGKRKPQSYDYAPCYPRLQYYLSQGAFYGGEFRNLPATGCNLQSADSEPAQNPPVDTREMRSSDFACVVFRLSRTLYRPLFKQIPGARRSISNGHTTPRKSAARLVGRLCLLGVRLPLSSHQKSEASRSPPVMHSLIRFA